MQSQKKENVQSARTCNAAKYRISNQRLYASNGEVSLPSRATRRSPLRFYRTESSRFRNHASLRSMKTHPTQEEAKAHQLRK
jgi:hypothetical protein